MKIFVLSTGMYREEAAVGAYSSLENAQAAAVAALGGAKLEWDDSGPDHKLVGRWWSQELREGDHYGEHAFIADFDLDAEVASDTHS